VIWTIARRELTGYLYAPLSWVLLAANQLLLAWVFLRVVERFTGLEAAQRSTGVTQELTLNLYGFAGALALFSVPLLTLRPFSEEFRRGSFTLLNSAPLSLTQILFGKLAGLAPLLGALICLPLLMSLSLLPWTRLDQGLLFASTLGLALLYLCFAAVGLFCSSLTSRPALAATTAYGILLALSVVNHDAATDPLGGALLDWLSWNEHFLPFLLGMVQTSDIAYFVILAALFLALTWHRLTVRRRQG
jgi:ABC-2 type transport system permease protein